MDPTYTKEGKQIQDYPLEPVLASLIALTLLRRFWKMQLTIKFSITLREKQLVYI